MFKFPVDSWVKNIQSLLYPPRCVLCEAPGADGLDLCAGCRGDLPRQAHACLRCAAALPATAPVTLCPDCLRHAQPFDSAWAALRYATPADWLILQLKFHARMSHARVLGHLMADGLEHHLGGQPAGQRPELIVPVPLHRRRWIERGFNQAAEIARPLGRRLGLPVAERSVSRQRDTDHQADLPAGKRRANVRKAFTADPALAGRRVAIVDDVVTTGHTAAALARTLKKAGAANVALWCATRA